MISVVAASSSSAPAKPESLDPMSEDDEDDVDTGPNKQTQYQLPRVYRTGQAWQAYSFRLGEHYNLGIHLTKYHALEAVARYEIRQGRGRFNMRTTLNANGAEVSFSAPIEPPPPAKPEGSSTDIKRVYKSGDMYVAQSFKNGFWHYLGRHLQSEAAARAIANFEGSYDMRFNMQQGGGGGAPTSQDAMHRGLQLPDHPVSDAMQEKKYKKNQFVEQQQANQREAALKKKTKMAKQRRKAALGSELEVEAPSHVLNLGTPLPISDPYANYDDASERDELESVASGASSGASDRAAKRAAHREIMLAEANKKPKVQTARQKKREEELARAANEASAAQPQQLELDASKVAGEEEGNEGGRAGKMVVDVESEAHLSEAPTASDQAAAAATAATAVAAAAAGAVAAGPTKKWSARVDRGGLRQIGLLDTREDALEAVSMFKEYEAETDSDDEAVPGVYRVGRRWKAIAFNNAEKANSKKDMPAYTHAYDLGLWDMKAEAVSALNIFKTRSKVVYGGNAELNADILASMKSDVEKSASGYRGVSIRGNKFQGRYRRGGKEHYCGNFDTLEIALEAIMHSKDNPNSTQNTGLSADALLHIIANEISEVAHLSNAEDDVNDRVSNKAIWEWEVSATPGGAEIGKARTLEEAVKMAINHQHKNREPELPEEHEVVEVIVDSTNQAS